jgi:peptide/nickel transport system permease protein
VSVQDAAVVEMTPQGPVGNPPVGKPASGFWRRARRHRSFVVGGVLCLVVSSAALLSLVWTPWSPYDLDLASKLRPPSSEHWLGTDIFGRDIASLLLVGARSSILVGVIAVGIGLLFGLLLGLVAAARKGWVEEAIMRLGDFTFAFPAVLSAIMLAAVAGPGMVTSITAIGIFQIPIFIRVSRASANAIWAREFVLASRASGKGKVRITIEHVLPNILSVLIVQATVQFALAILAEAALSYLGSAPSRRSRRGEGCSTRRRPCCFRRRCWRSIRASPSPSPCWD